MKKIFKKGKLKSLLSGFLALLMVATSIGVTPMDVQAGSTDNTGTIDESAYGAYGSGKLFPLAWKNVTDMSGFTKGDDGYKATGDGSVYLTKNGIYADSNGDYRFMDIKIEFDLHDGNAYTLVGEQGGSGNIWIAGGDVWSGTHGEDWGPADIEMKFYFYDHESKAAIDMKGYMYLHDLDGNLDWFDNVSSNAHDEGVKVTNGLKQYYTASNTTIEWDGSWLTGSEPHDGDDWKATVGFTYDSSPSSPLTLRYYSPYSRSTTIDSAIYDGTIELPSDVKVQKKITNPSNYEQSLAGFWFRLQGTSNDGAKIDKGAKTDANGVATFSKIPAGTYTVTEVGSNNSPQGISSWWDCTANGSQSVKVKNSIVSVDNMDADLVVNASPVTNVYKTGNVTVQKKITEDKDGANGTSIVAHEVAQPLNGFAYKLSGTSTSGDAVTEYAVTNTAGKAEFKNIPIGSYSVVEVSASSVPSSAACKASATQELKQYDKPAAQDVTVTYGTTTAIGEDYNNIYMTGHLVVQKTIKEDKVGADGVNTVAYDTEQPLNGFAYKLSGTSNAGEKVTEYAVTDESGYVQFKNVPAGTYDLEEVSASTVPSSASCKRAATQELKQYDKPAKQQVEIKYNTTTHTSSVTNTANTNIFKTGRVAVQKSIVQDVDGTENKVSVVAYDAGLTLDGFAYKLSGTSDNGYKVEEYGVTDSTGKLTFINIPEGTYELEEIPASKVPSSADCKDAATRELAEFEIVNKETVKVTYDSTNHTPVTTSEIMTNAYRSGRVAATKAIKQDDEVVANGTSIVEYQSTHTVDGFAVKLYGTSDFGDKVELYAVTNTSGKVMFKNVPIGTYTLEEISASAVPNGEHCKNYASKELTEYDIPAKQEVKVTYGGWNADKAAVDYVTVEVGLTNIHMTGRLELTKTVELAPEDMYDGEAEAKYHYNTSVEGFAYHLEGTSDFGDKVDLYATTDEAGQLIFTRVPQGTYTLTEVRASEVPASASCKRTATQELIQYVIPESETVKISYDKSTHSHVPTIVAYENILKKFSVFGTKQDYEAEESQISQGNSTLAGAVYGLYDNGKLVATAETDENGQYAFDGYYVVGDLWTIKEISASEGYLIDPATYYVEACAKDYITANEEHNIAHFNAKIYHSSDEKAMDTVVEYVKKASVDFYKVTGSNLDAMLDPLKDAGFTLYLATDLNPDYEKLSDEELSQAVLDDYRDEEKWIYGSLKDEHPAIVYAAADDEDVTSGKLVKEVTYSTGDVVKVSDFTDNKNAYFVNEIKSDGNGVCESPRIPFGRYVAVETTVPGDHTAAKAFVINITEDNLDDETYGDNLGEDMKDIWIPMDKDVMSLIRIAKADSQSGKRVLQEGVTYLIKDTEGAWLDYYMTDRESDDEVTYRDVYEAEDGTVYVGMYVAGEWVGTPDNPYTTKVMDGDVYIETPFELPVGNYELVELEAPYGYVAPGFEGVIAKNKELTAYNQTFFETEEDGMWDPAPKNESGFRVDASTASYDRSILHFVVDAVQANDPVIGKISIYAEGEQLAGVTQNGSTIIERLGDKIDEFRGYTSGTIASVRDEYEDAVETAELSTYKNYEFTYKMGPIEGAVFEIRAAEDIYSPEGGENSKLLFSKGDLVDTLITDANGQAWTGQEDWPETDIAKGLPLGKYEVTQVYAGYGFGLSEENAEPRLIEIEYAGQEVPVVYRDTAYENPRTKTELEVVKYDLETGREMDGAVFGLYALEDIVNAKGNVIIEAGTLVAIGEGTMENDPVVAHASFDDVPFGKYYVRELFAPQGMTTRLTSVPCDLVYAENALVLNADCEVSNEPTRVQINLMDWSTEKELTGGTLQLLDEDGNVVEEFEASEGHNPILTYLVFGDTYTVVEKEAPEDYDKLTLIKDGYTTGYHGIELDKEYVESYPTDSVKFTVLDVEDLQVVSIFNRQSLDIEKKQAVNDGEMTTDTLEVLAGDTVHYELTLTNPNDANADDVVMSDPIPAGLVVDTASISNDGFYDANDNTITWDIGTIDAGETITVTFDVTVPEDWSEVTSWTNVGYVGYAVNPGNPDDVPVQNPSNEVVIKTGEPELVLEKQQKLNNGLFTTDTLKISAGDVATYQLKVANTGKLVATDVVIKDTVAKDLIVNAESINNDGEYDEATGTITWNVGNVEVGGEVVLTFEVSLTDGKPDADLFKNMFTATHTNNPENPESPEPPVEIESNEVTMEPGTPYMTYAKMQRVNPDGIYGETEDALGSGESAVTGTAGAVVADLVVPTDETADAEQTKSEAVAELETAGFTVDRMRVNAGELVEYALIATNDGDSSAANLVLTDTVEEGLIVYEASISNDGVYDEVTRTLTWNLGYVPAGETVVVTFQVAVAHNVEPETAWTNVFTGTYSNNPENPDPTEEEPNPVPVPETSNEVVIDTGCPYLSLEKTQKVGDGEFTTEKLSVSVDDVVTYNLHVENTGELNATDVVIKDVVPEGVIVDAASISDGGVYDLATRTITWTLGTIEVESAKDLTFAVSVDGNAASVKNLFTATFSNNPENPEPTEEVPTPEPKPVESNEVELEVELPHLVYEKYQKVETSDVNTETDVEDDTNAETEESTGDANVVTGGVADAVVAVTDEIVDDETVESEEDATVDTDVDETPVDDGYTTEKQSVKAGDVVSYKLVVRNDSTSDAKDVTIQDTVEEGLVVDTDSISDGGVYDETTRTITWTLGNVAVGSEIAVGFDVTVDEVTEAKVLANVFTGTYSNNPANPDPTEEEPNPAPVSETSNTVEVEVEPGVPNLVLHKMQKINDGKFTDSKLEIKDGDVATYHLTATNDGELFAENVVVKDVVPEGLVVDTDSISDGGVYDEATRTITWNVGNVEAGQSVAVTFDVSLAADVEEPVDNTEDTTDETVVDETETDAEVENTDATADVVADDTVDVDNTESTETEDVENTEDETSDSKEEQAVSYLNVFTATYDNNPANQVINPDDSEDGEDGETSEPTIELNVIVSNEVELVKNPEEPIPDAGELILEKKQSVNKGEFTSDKLQIVAGDVVTYELTVKNETAEDAEDVTIKDTIEEGLVVDTKSISNDGTYDEKTRGLEWNVGTVKAGESVSVTFNVTLSEEVTGAKEFCNVFTISQPDKEDVPSNPVDVETGKAHLTLTKQQKLDDGEFTKDAVLLKEDSKLTYQLAVVNDGKEPAEGVVIKDTVAEGLVVDTESISDKGTYDTKTRTITWELGDVEAGKTVNLTFTVTGKKDLNEATTWKNVFVATFTNNPENPEDGDPVEVTSNEVVAKNGEPHVTLEKQQSLDGKTFTAEPQVVTGGNELTYQITVKSDGELKALGVVVTDVVPEGLELVKDSISNDGTYDEKTRTITWKLGDITEGTEKVVTFKTTVPGPDKETVYENVAKASWTNDPSKKGSESNKVTTNQYGPTLYLQKSQKLDVEGANATTDAISVKEGNTVIYYIKVGNNTETTAKNVVVTDKIPAGMTLVEGSINAGGSVKDGVVTWSIGDVEAKKGTTLTFKVTVPGASKETTYENTAEMKSDNADAVKSNTVKAVQKIISTTEIAEVVTGVDNNSGMIAAIVISLLGLAMVAGGFYVYRRRKLFR